MDTERGSTGASKNSLLVSEARRNARCSKGYLWAPLQMHVLEELANTMDRSLESRIASVLARQDPASRLQAEADIALLKRMDRLSVSGFLQTATDLQAAQELRRAAVWLLGQIEETSAEPGLMHIMQSSTDDQLIWEAAKAIVSTARSDTGFTLQKVLRELRLPVARQAAVYALGHLGSSPALESLVSILNDLGECVEVRAQAAEALGQIGDSRAIQPLLYALSDVSPEIRFWAAFALGQLGDPSAIPQLEHVAATDRSIIPGWGEVAAEAQEAISQIRDRLQSR